MDQNTNRRTEVLNERGVNIQVLKRGQFSSVDNTAIAPRRENTRVAPTLTRPSGQKESR
jgi:hypothetical protein